MGDSRVVMLQEEISLVLPPAGTFSQSENHAVDVLPFTTVTPYIRIKKSAITTAALLGAPVPESGIKGQGIAFAFGSGPGMMYPDESTLTGSRFVLAASFKIAERDNNINGQTFAVPTINNPGANLLLVVFNLDGSATQALTFDVQLVCRCCA